MNIFRWFQTFHIHFQVTSNVPRLQCSNIQTKHYTQRWAVYFYWGGVGGLKSVFGNSETIVVNFCTSSYLFFCPILQMVNKIEYVAALIYAYLLKLSITTGCTISVCLRTIPACAKIEKSAVNCNCRNLCTFSPKTCPDQTPVFRLCKYFQSEWQIWCHFYFLIWISSKVLTIKIKYIQFHLAVSEPLIVPHWSLAKTCQSGNCSLHLGMLCLHHTKLKQLLLPLIFLSEHMLFYDLQLNVHAC